MSVRRVRHHLYFEQFPRDATLHEIDTAYRNVIAGGDTRRGQAFARDFVRAVDLSAAGDTPLDSDLQNGVLQAIHVLSTNERLQDPLSPRAAIWADLGLDAARRFQWAGWGQAMEMLNLISVSAARDADLLRVRLKTLDHLAQSAPLAIRSEYFARVVDLLHMTHAWQDCARVVDTQIVPLSVRHETAPFQASRRIAAARAKLRIGGNRVRDAEQDLALADDLLSASERSSEPHDYFRFWHALTVAELMAAASEPDHAERILTQARTHAQANAFDSAFLEDSARFIELQSFAGSKSRLIVDLAARAKQLSSRALLGRHNRA